MRDWFLPFEMACQSLNTPSLEHDVIFQSINQGFAILLGSWSSLTCFVFIKMLLKPSDITSSTEQRMQMKASLAEDPDFCKKHLQPLD